MLTLERLAGGIDMDVLLVPNLGSVGDRALAQRDKLMPPLLRLSDEGIARLAQLPPDRARERAVCEAHTMYVKSTPEPVNTIVRLFKVRRAGWSRPLCLSSRHPNLKLQEDDEDR